MNIETVYVAIEEDNEGREYETTVAFRRSEQAEVYSAPGRWAHIGKAKKIDVVRMDDGTYRRLGDRIGVYDNGKELLREQALSKLSKSEKILLGLIPDPDAEPF